jgi:5'-3' exonuclease
MDLFVTFQKYIDRIIDRFEGMKILLLDEDTVSPRNYLIN